MPRAATYAPALTPPLVLQEYVSLSLSGGSGSSSSSQTTRLLQSESGRAVR